MTFFPELIKLSGKEERKSDFTMKWLRRLVRYLLQGEEEEQRFSYEEVKQAEPASSHLDVKVTYQYPKGNFRFPLIPDEPASVRRPNSSALSEMEKRGEHSHRLIRERQRAIGESRERHRESTGETEKRRFRPSEVPSPIYGYKKPTKTSETIEFELLPTTIEHKGIDDERSEPQLLKQDDNELETLEAVDQLATGEETKSQIDKSIDEHVTQETNKQLREESEKSAFSEVEASEEHKEETAESVSENKDEPLRTTEESAPVKSVRSRIPYNVIMLKQDRKKWEEAKKKEETTNSYHFPPLSLLQPSLEKKGHDEQWLNEQRERLDKTFQSFNIGAKVVHLTQGPTVTRFEVQPAPGVKVNKITSLADDIKLSLAAKDIRIEAPIPGKSTIGIEVPNVQSRPVFIREILQSETFRTSASPLTVALGLDISGAPVVTDLKKMPHGLIAGATGSGKSVCINAMLVSLLYKAAPHEVKLLLIDPKMVELAPYNHIPHLVSPVITDVKAATGALKWAVEEMERRYELFAHAGVRDIQKYNELVKKEQTPEHHLPYIVIIIDELADLMMVAPGDVEEAICRIAQKARACGIHLIVATQRPSVDVITGLIKANIPTRIAFSVSSQIDSRTIIDTNGAEKLLGRGDMLFLENGTSKTVRVQGNFVSDEEIERVVAHVKAQMSPSYLFEQEDFLKQSTVSAEGDELFYEACEFVVQQGGASTSSLQRRFRIGYNRAARLIEMMEEQGIISEARGSKPRDVLITEEELANLQENSMI